MRKWEYLEVRIGRENLTLKVSEVIENGIDVSDRWLGKSMIDVFNYYGDKGWEIASSKGWRGFNFKRLKE